MKLSSDTKIAGHNTVGMWNSIRSDLENFENLTLWERTYNDFFVERIKTRYLNPIDSIKKDDTENG